MLRMFNKHESEHDQRKVDDGIDPAQLPFGQAEHGRDRAPWTPAVVGAAARAACLLEVRAPKPGNITPDHDFADTAYGDMVASGEAIAPVLAAAGGRGVGATILAGVEATRTVAAANTNLGIVLLLAPVAHAALTARAGEDLDAAVARVLAALDTDDAAGAFAAIRMAAPGGLGDSPEHDVRDAPTVGLRESMAAAAHRDQIAAEYAAGFPVVLDAGPRLLAAALEVAPDPDTAVVELQLRLLAAAPDSLIARKRGAAAAADVSARARDVLACGGTATAPGRAALEALDAHLRTDGNRLNPGTTADLIAAILFVALLTGRMATGELGA